MIKRDIKPATLLLQDGTVFYGKSIGLMGTTTGEIAFNTGMTGYQEIFTDPSYYGQLLVMATPHIGNYGVHKLEIESNSVKIAGLICKRFSETYSRFGEIDWLQTYFEQNNIVGISDVDTRALVRHIRDNGAQNAIISSEGLSVDELKKKLSKVPSMKGLELASKVSTQQAYEVGESNAAFKVALLDYGVKKNIVRCLVERGCFVKVFPYNATFDEIMNFSPDGIMLSNGPGDPEPLTQSIQVIKQLLDTKLPLFGICLGHQLLAISQGLTTEKMHNGHRGINHPIKNLVTGKGEITSQNHGFVVNMEQAKKHPNIEVTHIHLNDHTLAGIALKDRKAFSVQYHPEASPGPHDSRYLFDQFLENIKIHQKQLV
ncbi:MAG: glutamine-hydrolyzing carbamoyl-phosphate synthase small subunit [Bacteroidia bacterium]